jgi:sec-independent protein translocase protein TatA
MLQGIGATEILIILGIVVLLFGAKKLPELARGSGQALRIFKTEVKGDGSEEPEAIEGRVLEASADPAAEKKPEQQV